MLRINTPVMAVLLLHSKAKVNTNTHRNKWGNSTEEADVKNTVPWQVKLIYLHFHLCRSLSHFAPSLGLSLSSQQHQYPFSDT